MLTLAFRPDAYLQKAERVARRPLAGHWTTRRRECRASRSASIRVGRETKIGTLRLLSGI
jgi:hypothetical protein